MKSSSIPLDSLLKAISYIFLTLFLLLSANQNAITQVLHPKVSEADSLALIKIYNAMNGPDWNYNHDWLTGRVHTWAGVVVPDYEDRVQQIILYSNNLSGVFPEIETGLEQLKTINFNDNNLSGAFPENICSITSLEGLSLAGNQIDGDIPESINKLVNLKFLDLKNNKIGSIDPNAFMINTFADLGRLELNQNNIVISDEVVGMNILKALCSYVNLYYVDLSYNSFNCPLTEEIGNLDKLTHLNLYQCGLSDVIPMEIGNLINLRYLNLGNNNLQGDVPQSLENLVLLSGSFILSNNNLTGLPKLSPFPNVQTFDIRKNRFTFKDIIPNLNVAQNVYYAPQDSIGIKETFFIEYGKSLTIVADSVKADEVQFSWLRDGTSVMDGEGAEYTIQNATQADSGALYVASMTNVKAPLLTLYNRPKKILTGETLYPDGFNWRDAALMVVVVEVTDDALVSLQGKDWKDVRVGQVLTWGDEITTGIESGITVLMPNRSKIDINELTSLKIGSLFRESDVLKTRLLLKIGELEAVVKPKTTTYSDFSVRTPVSTASVRGTYFGVHHDSTTMLTTVSVSEGQVMVSNEGFEIPGENLCYKSNSDSVLIQDWQQVTVSEAGLGAIENITLQKIEVGRDTIKLHSGQRIQLSASGIDTKGLRMKVKVDWNVSGGTIDSTGIYTAGSQEGIFTVSATEPKHNLTASAVVIIEGEAVGITLPNYEQTLLRLSQNYPNPFKTFTTIDYALPQSSKVTLKIFNLLGEEVAEIVNEDKAAGEHSIHLNAEELESGTYFYRLRAGQSSVIKKMLILK
jgi:hypothetical protein